MPDDDPGRGARLGVLGGTFDPPHAGHLALAEAASAQFDLDRVLFVVAGDPWQKRGDVRATARDRLAMTEALVRGHRDFEVSAMEVERDGPSYTAETLDELATVPGEPGETGELFLILGADAAAGLDTWHRSDRIRELARLIVAPRPGEGPGAEDVVADLEGRGWRCDLLVLDEHAVSSTDVRVRLDRGEPIASLVPPEVVRVIEDRGLYTRS